MECISTDKLEYIFNRFYTDSTDNEEGIGIGLHLTQEFVKMYGGEIIVESEPNKKTVFIIEIPNGNQYLSEYSIMESQNEILDAEIESILDAEKTKEIITGKYNYTILIVEDDHDIRKYLSEELSTNFNILLAENGLEAMQLLEQQTHITLVLSDD